MSRRKLLLTGAGFTANFGAPLAAHMWNWIYGAGSLQGQDALLEKMRNDLDFERVYFEVITGAYSEAQKRAMSDAMLDAFRNLDEIVRTCMPHRHVGTYALDELLASFAGRRGNRGYIFTLNQDLYLERWYAKDERPLLPGLPPNSIWRDDLRRQGRFTLDDYVIVPDEAAVEQHKARLSQHETFAYLKLHGSANWLRPNGERQMVLGGQKSESIEAQPLLKWYMEMFREVLNEPNRLLLIIGYGFGDSHINAVMAEAIANSGLRFVVVNPCLTRELLARLRADRYHWQILEHGLASHVPHTLREIFPPVQQVGLQNVASAGWALLKRDFMDQPE